jgi:hypothetical protein
VVVFERGVLGSRGRGRSGEELWFEEVRQEGMSDLEEVFENECEKCWLWGRVKGWEDVRAKLRFKWKGECGFVEEEEVQDDLYGYSGVEPRTDGVKGLGLGIGMNMGTGTRKESVDLSLQSLLLSVDDVLEEYGAMDAGADADVEEEYEYSESEYSVEDGDEEELEREREWEWEREEFLRKRRFSGSREVVGFGESRGLGISESRGLGIGEKRGWGALGESRGLGISERRGGGPLPQVEDVYVDVEVEDERDWDYGFEEEGNWI